MRIRARETARANQASGQIWLRVSRKRRSVPFPRAYGRLGFRGTDNNRLAAPVKAAIWPISGLFRGQDRDRDRIVLGSRYLQDEWARRELVFHGLADAVAIGRAAECLRL